MQEEASQRTVSLVVKAAKLTEEVLRRALVAYLNGQARKIVPEKHGQMTVKELLQKDQGANTYEINTGNIRYFNRVASKYNIDYAIQKDKSQNPPKYVLFFKARDQDVIVRAFKDYCDLNERKSERPSLRAKLDRIIARKPKSQDKERTRTKDLNKEKEASL